MTRYYDIQITPKGSNTPMFAFGSHPNGQFDPGALNVEFDMPVLAYDTPAGGQTITIEGISLDTISQAQNFAGANIVVRGGMQAGLPLANPSQAGVILSGNIFQSYGNWQGTEMTLDFMVLPAIYTMGAPGNFVLNWTQGTPLSDALKTTLGIAYPGMPIMMNIGSNLVLDSDEHHYCSTLEELAGYIGNLTESAFGGQRVTITIQSGKLVIYDKTYQPSPVQIQFTDLIGQPTWIDQQTMQVKTVMRADLQIGGMITMPKGFQNTPGFVNTWGSSLPSSNKYQSAFQNNFQVKELRHLGNFRSSDSSDWCTVFNCLATG